MPRHLVVPIDLEALCATGEAQPHCSFMPSLTKFDEMPYGSQEKPSPFRSEDLMQVPFDGLAESLEPGVHLHWAMPDALMRGTVKEDTMRFGALPDRWLLLRLSFTAAGTPGPTRALVIDSRHLDTNQRKQKGTLHSVAIPLEPAVADPDVKKPHYKFLGRSGDLEWWQDKNPDAPALDSINAATFGRVELAAFYPNTRNVFGVLDDLGDLATDGEAPRDRWRFSYVVIGWHTLIDDDPIARKPQAEALKALKWAVDGEGELDRAVYCGVVHSVLWDPNAAPIKPPEPLKVAFGNTTSEALAALLIKEVTGATPELEFQLNALLSGLLDQLGEFDGERKVRRQLHLQRFAAAPGGHLWYARRKENGVAPDADGGDASDLLPADLKAALADLNQEQEALDRLTTTLEDQRWRVFADWYKYLESSYPGGDSHAGMPHASAIRTFMQEVSLRAVDNIRADIVKAEEAVKKARGTLVDKLVEVELDAKTEPDAKVKLPALELALKPSSRYWRPRDPVLLLSGPDVQPAWRYGGDHLHRDDETLLCRGSDALIRELNVAAAAVPGLPALGLGAVDGGSPWPEQGGAAVPSDLLEVAQALAFEAALLSPDWAAAKLSTKAGGAVAPAPIAAWFAKLIADGPARQSGVYVGTLPSPVGWRTWQTPWLPIMILWELSYRPLQAIANPTQTFDPELIVSRLSGSHGGLDADDADIALHLAKTTITEIGSTYTDMTFLSPHAGIAFRKRIDDYVKTHPKTKLAGLRDALTEKTIPLLSQALSGLEDRFLMRRQTFQLGIADPFVTTKDVKDFIAMVRRAV